MGWDAQKFVCVGGGGVLGVHLFFYGIPLSGMLKKSVLLWQLQVALQNGCDEGAAVY